MSYYTIKFNTTVQFEILTELDENQIKEVTDKWETMKELNKPFSKSSDKELYEMLIKNVTTQDIVQIVDAPVKIVDINEYKAESENYIVENEDENEDDYDLDKIINEMIKQADGN